MKKEYISPEMLTVEFDTASLMQVAITSDPSQAVDPANTRAPGFDEEDEEDWEDDGKASRNGRRGY